MRKFSLIFLLLAILIFPRQSFALSFDLIPPAGQLTRGQTITFSIDVDTEGANLTSTQVGMTYDTNYLQYVSTTPGDTFASITASPLDNGKLLISGSSPQGFSGTGSFAEVNFILTAAAPGSTELCVLFAPSVTPTPPPSTTPAPTTPYSTPQPTVVLPTSRIGLSITPTALPTTGANTPDSLPFIVLFIVVSAGGLMFSSRMTTVPAKHKPHKK